MKNKTQHLLIGFLLLSFLSPNIVFGQQIALPINDQNNPITFQTDPDTDGDGIPDSLDQCINEAETVNGFQDTDGCPDTAPPADTDGDG
ncbi:MAG: hypothetical protein JHC41_07730, partial [Nitrosopumilus sp.]|nr:hypothetical protein [Nitrosopumilus sp.]